MMVHLKIIQRVYKKFGIKVERAKGIEPYCTDLDQIFRVLVPQSYFTFNDEFSSPDEFLLVLDGMSRITNGEISFSGGGFEKKGSSLKWWFSVEEKIFSWTSKGCQAPALDKGFFRAISRMSRSLFSGDYVFHEIDAGYMGAVYARRDVAKKLTSKLKKPSIDSLVSYYRKGGDFLVSHLDHLKEMGDMRDSKGDTVVTAILKSDSSPEFRCYLAWWMIENAPMLSPYVPDGNGDMPIDIARRLGLDEFVSHVMKFYERIHHSVDEYKESARRNEREWKLYTHMQDFLDGYAGDMAVVLNPFVLLCKDYNQNYKGFCAEVSECFWDRSFMKVEFYGPFKRRPAVFVEKSELSSCLARFFENANMASNL